MARYYFHVRDGEDFVKDSDGSEVPDLDTAREEAKQSASEIVADLIAARKLVGRQQFEISDDAGNTLAIIPFSSIIRLR